MERRTILITLACSSLAAAACSEKDPGGKTAEVPVSQTTAPAASGSAPTVPAASGSAATQPAAASATNVLVLSIDSLRADRMADRGYKNDVMPNVTAFAKTAANFKRFYAASSYTSMSLGGFLAGRYASELKRSGYFFGVYPEEETFFPELLQKAGVRTMSAHAHFYFSKEKAGFHQGFDVWDLLPGLKKSNTTDENITSPAHTEVILQHLGSAENTKGRFFAWYHLLDPHDQYMTHPEGKDFGKSASEKYDGEIYFTDQHVGKILAYVDSQPWGKNTAVIITSDHGEAFGEHRQYRHGFEIWENLTHVPLLIRIPGVKGRVVEEPRGMIDLAPTILELFGVQPTPEMHGTSLVAEVKGADPGARDVIVDLARTSDNDRRRALVRGNFKIYELGDKDAYQLFDVVNDPGEKDDLVKKDKAKLEEMKKALDDANAKIKDVCPKMTEKLKGKKKNKPC